MSCLQAILRLPTQSWRAVVQHGTVSQDCRDLHPRGEDVVSNNGKSWRDYPESQVKSTHMPPRIPRDKMAISKPILKAIQATSWWR